MVFRKYSYQNRQNWCARESCNGFSLSLLLFILILSATILSNSNAQNNDIKQFFARKLRSKEQSFVETRCFNTSSMLQLQYKFDDCKHHDFVVQLVKADGSDKLKNIIHVNKWLSYNNIYR